MFQLTDGVVDIIMYPSSTDKSKNRGFAFVEYKSHKAAAMARRKLIPGAYVIYLIRLCLVCSCLSACCLWIRCVLSICAFYFLTYICVNSGLVPRGCTPGTFQLWGQPVQVDWAEPEKDAAEEVMQRVRVLYVSQLMTE